MDCNKDKPKRRPHTKGLRTFDEDATKESAMADYMTLYKGGASQSKVKSRRIKKSGGCGEGGCQ